MQRFLLLLSLVLLAGACGTSVCEDDRFECQSGDLFALDPGCSLTGTLEVEVGGGESNWQSLGDAMPKTTEGGQGGTHAFAGVRVANAALDRYDKLRVSLAYWGETQAPCSSFKSRDWTSERGSVADVELKACKATEPCMPAEGEICVGRFAQRTVVMGGNKPLNVVDGAVEEVGMLVFNVPALDEPLLTTWVVEDPCGQIGEDNRVAAP